MELLGALGRAGDLRPLGGCPSRCVPAAWRGGGGPFVLLSCVMVALLCQAGAAHQGPHGDGGEAVYQGAEDAAADAGEEEQVRREGEHRGPVARLQPRSLSPGCSATSCSGAGPAAGTLRMCIYLGRATCCGKCCLTTTCRTRNPAPKGKSWMLLGEVSAPLLCIPCLSVLLTHTSNPQLPSQDGTRSVAGCHASPSVGVKDDEGMGLRCPWQ